MESDRMANPERVTFSFTRPLDFPAAPAGDDGEASPHVIRRNVTCRVTADESGPQATVRLTELFVADRLLYQVRCEADGQLTCTVFGRIRGGAFEPAEHSFTGRCDEPGIFLSSGSAFLCRMAWSLVPGAEEDGDETVYTSEAEARAAAGSTGRVVSFRMSNGCEVVPHYLVESPAQQAAGRILGCYLSANRLLQKMERLPEAAAALHGSVIAPSEP